MKIHTLIATKEHPLSLQSADAYSDCDFFSHFIFTRYFLHFNLHLNCIYFHIFVHDSFHLWDSIREERVILYDSFTFTWYFTSFLYLDMWFLQFICFHVWIYLLPRFILTRFEFFMINLLLHHSFVFTCDDILWIFFACSIFSCELCMNLLFGIAFYTFPLFSRVILDFFIFVSEFT